MDIRKFAVSPTARLHLRDASDQLMYADDDLCKPIAVNVYGPGSKEYASAQSEQNNRILEKLKTKGKSSQTAQQKTQEVAEFLADCTAGFENLEYGDLTGDAVIQAVYADIEIGFIADQVARFIGDWSNFTKPSTQG